MQITNSGSARMLNSGKGFCVVHHPNGAELEKVGLRGEKKACPFFCDLGSVDSCTVVPLLGLLILWLLEISVSRVNKKE